MSACFWLCPAGKLLWKVLILFHCHGVLILPSALMTHETLTSCFIHVLTPPVPVVHTSRSMFKCLVISPFVLLCPFWLFLNRVFSVPVCLSVCLCLCDVCSGPPPDTPLIASWEEFNLWPFLLGFWPVGLLQGALKGLVWCLLSPCISSSMSILMIVCVMEDGWSGLPCSSSPHGAMWRESEVMEFFFFFFFRVLCFCLDEYFPKTSDPVVAPLPVCMDACM